LKQRGVKIDVGKGNTEAMKRAGAILLIYVGKGEGVVWLKCSHSREENEQELLLTLESKWGWGETVEWTTGARIKR